MCGVWGGGGGGEGRDVLGGRKRMQEQGKDEQVSGMEVLDYGMEWRCIVECDRELGRHENY